jgi:hypothetical protein
MYGFGLFVRNSVRMMACGNYSTDGNTCSFTNTPKRELKEHLGQSNLLDILTLLNYYIA